MADQEETLLGATQEHPAPPPSPRLEQIFAEHHARVFGAAFRVTGSAQDAEDVLQTVFLRLLRRQDQLDLSPHPTSYLHRAAVNASLDLVRARSRSRSIGLDELESAASGDPEADPERQRASREARRLLRRAILELTPKSAELFTLRYLEGVSNREIARMTGMSQTAVAVALHRSRAQVKKHIRSLSGGD